MPFVSRDSEPSVQDREDRQLRALFWICYVFDKDMALRTGQPPIISDDFCDLTLPEWSDESRFVTNSPGRDRAGMPRNNELEVPWFPGDLRLSLLKSKACRLLFSAPSLRQSDAELLRTIRELDEELESWRVSIPADFSPALSVSEKHARLVSDLDKSRGMLHIGLNLEYQYLMNVIHAASGRCMVDGSGPGQAASFGVQSSLELSVEASRSTLIYLSAAAKRLVGDAFWYVRSPSNCHRDAHASTRTGSLSSIPCRPS